jgi:HAD superfamily hydrolase (TIGR01509 family)
VPEVRAAVDRWFDHAPLALLPRCVYSGLPEFLRLLSELGIPRGVFSDYPAEAKLSAMGLSGFFSHALSAADVGRQKPDPTGVLDVARLIGTAPAYTLYVGDRTIDLEAAARAGMQGTLIRNGTSYPTLHNRFAGRRRERLP